ncbi:hypothetical protein [Lysobacter claricitrinus]|uniref:hypothetical protein n=1 Tax=Lysobacter claricitrinus TaxID=3367728 RepID=UPI0037DBE4D1
MRLDVSTRFAQVALLAAAIVVLPFLPGVGGDFIFDDRQTIQYNDALRIASFDLQSFLYAAYSYHAGHGSRALTMLTFALDFWRGGADPAVFKSTNIAIHAVTTVVLAVFLRLLLSLAGWQPRRAAIGALVMAALWAVHPLQVSAVLYVVQRMQTLGTLFLILALWAYAKMRQAQISDARSRQFGVLTVLFWGLAFASKEDSALLPVYTLLLELTVLRFDAARPVIRRRLSRAYMALTVLGGLAYFFVIVPHYWHWDAYPGRTFSSYERLLTEARVLVMYVGQVLLPVPQHMPFYYDDLAVSRSLLSPPGTAPAIVALLALVILAWRLRTRRPLFAFGVLLFFAAHFMTSTVLNLELAFEHRNHLPLVGAVIALGDLLLVVCERFRIRPVHMATCIACALLALASATATRAYTWGDPTRFAQSSVELAPNSERAWTDLCTHYFDLNAGVKGSPYIDKAISTCQEGAARTQSPLLLFDAIIYKTFKGSSTRADWPVFIRRLRDAPTSAEILGLYDSILRNVSRGFPMDVDGTLQALEIIADRAPLSAEQYATIAAYVYNNSPQPDAALPYLEKAVQSSPPNSRLVDKIFSDLSAAGHDDWVTSLRALPRAHSDSR